MSMCEAVDLFLMTLILNQTLSLIKLNKTDCIYCVCRKALLFIRAGVVNLWPKCPSELSASFQKTTHKDWFRISSGRCFFLESCCLRGKFSREGRRKERKRKKRKKTKKKNPVSREMVPSPTFLSFLHHLSPFQVHLQIWDSEIQQKLGEKELTSVDLLPIMSSIWFVSVQF